MSLKIKSIIFSSFFMILIVSLLVFNYFYKPNIIILDEVVINYGDDVTFDVSAFIKDKDISDSVEVFGEVDTSKEGVYYLDYSVEYGGFKDTDKLKVIVKDVAKPVIKFNENSYMVCPKKKYIEDILVLDNKDGDITDKVIVNKVGNNIFYLVSDSSGNITFDVRKVNYLDTTDPVIDLGSHSEIDVYLGEDYKELGYVAFDNCDGDLSDLVKVNNKVDTSKLGKYEVIYTVVDSSLNEFSITRTVNVVEKPEIGSIYLTFDDGPNTGSTDRILDILNNYNVDATFFVMGGGDDSLIKRMYDDGHTIGVHTNSHVYSDVYSSVENYYKDLELISDRVLKITGEKSYILRFPGGSSNTISNKYSKGIMSFLVNDVISKGYKYYDWNIDSGDARYGSSADDVYFNVVNSLSKDKYNMILLHDTKKKTVEALPRIIQYAIDNNYKFKKIDKSTEMITQRVNN